MADKPELLSSVWEALKSALRSATHLQVVTVLGDATVTTKDGLNEVEVTLPPRAEGAEPYRLMATNIDLALGDIAQTISPQLLDGTQEAVVQLHKEMVAHGQEIVSANLTLLKALAKELA